MIQTSPQMRILVARDPIDFRTRAKGTKAAIREVLDLDPLSGVLVIFRSKNRKAIRLYIYDGQGGWCMDKALTSGTFRHWDGFEDGAKAQAIEPHQLQLLVMAGEWMRALFPGYWRKLT
jgi:transposase